MGHKPVCYATETRKLKIIRKRNQRTVNAYLTSVPGNDTLNKFDQAMKRAIMDQMTEGYIHSKSKGALSFSSGEEDFK